MIWSARPMPTASRALPIRWVVVHPPPTAWARPLVWLWASTTQVALQARATRTMDRTDTPAVLTLPPKQHPAVPGLVVGVETQQIHHLVLFSVEMG